jgi:hypothetical protein
VALLPGTRSERKSAFPLVKHRDATAGLRDQAKPRTADLPVLIARVRSCENPSAARKLNVEMRAASCGRRNDAVVAKGEDGREVFPLLLRGTEPGSFPPGSTSSKSPSNRI